MQKQQTQETKRKRRVWPQSKVVSLPEVLELRLTDACVLCLQTPPARLPTVDAAEAHLPWRVAHTARLGRNAVAKRAIAPGELVLREAGAATIVRQRFLGHVCCVCFSELPAGAAAQPTQVQWCLQCQTGCHA